MVYKKYIKKNGKIYGPYIYNSKRVGGKVVSEYHGLKEQKNNSKNIFLILGILLIAMLLVVVLNLNLTGNITLNLNERINKNMELSLSKGELIPLNSKIKISTDNEEIEYNLSELVNQEKVEGNYYLQGENLKGTGQGIGLKGEKEKYPAVYFEFKIINSETSSSSSTESSNTTPLNNNSSPSENQSESQNSSTQQKTKSEESTENSETENSTNTESSKTEVQETSENSESETNTKENEPKESSQEEIPETTQQIETTQESTNKNTEQTISESTSQETPSTSENTAQENTQENQKETSEESKEEASEQSSEEPSEQSPGITGAITGFITRLNPTANVVSENSNEETIQGNVKYGEQFTYNLKQGQQIKIIPESIKTQEKELSQSDLKIEIKNNKVTITTEYKETEQGFGEEYLGETTLIPLNKEKINTTKDKIKKIELLVQENESQKNNPSQNKNNSENNSKGEIPNLNKTKDLENTTNTTIENQTQEITNTTSKINESKILLEENLGTSNITTILSEYRNKIIATMSIKQYEREFSYSKELSEQELETRVQEDKDNFIIDLANKYGEEKFKKVQINKIKTSENITNKTN
jgi:hypothetical protein